MCWGGEQGERAAFKGVPSQAGFPWMKQFIVELCSCLSAHLHLVKKIIRVHWEGRGRRGGRGGGVEGFYLIPRYPDTEDPRVRGLPVMLMHILITDSFSQSVSIEARCSLRFAPLWRRSATNTSPLLWGHFFSLFQLPVINT